MTGDYLKHDEADSTSVVMSPCGSKGNLLNINSQVRLTSTNTKGINLHHFVTVPFLLTH